MDAAAHLNPGSLNGRYVLICPRSGRLGPWLESKNLHRARSPDEMAAGNTKLLPHKANIAVRPQLVKNLLSVTPVSRRLLAALSDVNDIWESELQFCFL